MDPISLNWPTRQLLKWLIQPAGNRLLLHLLAITCAAGFSGCQEETAPVVVTGASMFPAYNGEHYQLTCRDCKFPFDIDANRAPKSGSAVCPNCGFAKNPFRQQKVSIGPEYQLAKTPETIDRWDVVAFHGDEKIVELPNQKWAIKRVVGLPGEEIEIRNGNVFADGQLLTKPVAIQQQMLIPVFDSKYLPANSQSQRLPVTKIGDSEIHVYRHIRGYRHRPKRFQSNPIEDSYGFNQNVARSLNQVEEVLVRVDDPTIAADEIRIRIQSRNSNFDVTWLPSQRLFEIQSYSATKSVNLPENMDGQSIASFSVSNFDSYGRIFVDDMLIVEFPIQETDPTSREQAFQIELELGDNGLSDRRVRIFRDVFYLSASESEIASASKWKLGTGEYFLLGDNSPVSIDSRKYGPIRQQAIVGRLEPTP